MQARTIGAKHNFFSGSPPHRTFNIVLSRKNISPPPRVPHLIKYLLTRNPVTGRFRPRRWLPKRSDLDGSASSTASSSTAASPVARKLSHSAHTTNIAATSRQDTKRNFWTIRAAVANSSACQVDRAKASSPLANVFSSLLLLPLKGL